MVAVPTHGIKMNAQAEVPARHAIILAAGRGSRLQPEEGHKLLVSIEGRTLLDRHLERFAALGVSAVTVVTGYRHRALEEELADWTTPEGMELHTAFNPDFDASNGLSVLAGVRGVEQRESVEAPHPFWLTMSDHVFEPGFVDAIRRDLSRAALDDLEAMLAVDTKIETIFDLDDANKVALSSDGSSRARLESIGKELERYDCIDAGFFWCDRGFVEALEARVDEQGDATTSDAVRRLSQRGTFDVLDIGDCLWQDVDTPEAREHAEQLVRHDWTHPDAIS